MGASFFNQKNSSKKKRIISEINITPFVDVLLVLLIIFMVAAPMMTSNVNVDLPKGAAAPNNEKIQPISVSIQSDGTLFLQDEAIKLGLLSAKLLEVTGNNLNSKIQVRADKKIDYGRVMDVIKTINLSGFSQVVLVTELAQ
ncbi:MAG: biopolymer transporter ExbD [Proteobacteria bacterium]|nr:biopolymer transporter ExbD [Pseudomonadota bacterium]